MVHCKQNKVDIKNFLAPLLLVTSQTRSASVESREVEALSNLRRRRPRGPSLGRTSRRKAAAVSLENKNFASSCTSREQGLGPARFFWAWSQAKRYSAPRPPGIAQVCSRSHRGQGRYNRLGGWSSCTGDFDANDHSRRCRAGCRVTDDQPSRAR